LVENPTADGQGGIPETAKTDPVAAALFKMGVPSGALTKIKDIFQDLKEKKLDVNNAKQQLEMPEKDALVASFLQMVVEDNTTNIANLFSALRNIAKQQK